MARLFAKRGASIARHSHVSEEYLWVVSGALEYRFDDGTKVSVHANEGLVVPPNVSHAIEVLRKTVAVYFFSPARDDWTRGEDQYLRA